MVELLLQGFPYLEFVWLLYLFVHWDLQLAVLETSVRMSWNFNFFILNLRVLFWVFEYRSYLYCYALFLVWTLKDWVSSLIWTQYLYLYCWYLIKCWADKVYKFWYDWGWVVYLLGQLQYQQPKSLMTWWLPFLTLIFRSATY